MGSEDGEIWKDSTLANLPRSWTSFFKADVHALPTRLLSRKNITEGKTENILTTGKVEKKKSFYLVSL